MQADIDNCIKPIPDALSQFVYVDDKQVDRIVAQKFEPGRSFEIRDDVTETLAETLAANEPTVDIKVGNDLRGE